MKSIVRNIVLLVASVLLVLLVLVTLLYGRHLTTTHHATLSAEFLSPVQNHLAQAQTSLLKLQAHLHDRVAPVEAPARMISTRLLLLVDLDNIEDHLMHVIRLSQKFDYQAAFGLPARALAQLQPAREHLLALTNPAPGEIRKSLALIEPLQNTLVQLEHIHELEMRKLDEKRRSAAASSIRLIVLAVILLVVIAVPFITVLTRHLTSSIKREIRTRQDLEEAKQSLELLAMHDSLTDIGNRNLFKARLEHVIQSTKRSLGVSALMYIDLDNFKRINDSLGHDSGDEVLKTVARRLQGAVREADTVARLGGDEFTVILSEVHSTGNIASITRKLLARIAEPISVSDIEVVVSASIGVTLIPSDGDDPALLMKNADMALYKAKDEGRNTFRFFVEAMHRAMLGKMTMENDLRAAIREQGFVLHYQPQIDLSSGKVACLEALIRWPRDTGDLVAPDEFLNVADEAGLMTEIGGWVLMQACADLARIRRDTAPGLRVSVNLSARQFQDPELGRRIEQALRANELDPSALEVEITETTLVEDIEGAASTLEALRALGVSVAIDDFGIGYSSLNYLKHLPIDALKIDRSFVRDIESDEADRSIVDAVVSMAHSLSLKVVAEGVETQWQLRYLTARECDLCQGYLFSRPLPLAELPLEKLSRNWEAHRGERVHAGLRVI